MDIEVFHQTVIRDINGEIKRDTGLTPSHSLVLQFLQLMEASMRHTTVSVKDITNTSRTVTPAQTQNWFYADAAAADDTFGVVVGTGVGAEANTDYVLGTQIAHGTGAGELEYEGTAYTVPTVFAPSVKTQIRRTFHNDSGGAITIEEHGVYVQCEDDGAAARTFCILRDLDSQAVADNETATSSFWFVTTV